MKFESSFSASLDIFCFAPQFISIYSWEESEVYKMCCICTLLLGV